ncbi:inositol monophosphatase [Vibrio sp. CAIM 722]|uniref:Inositol-1-monophosphatase n=1 Tax=Vibrio eleionomae TaxID=2653505 RepID=A0A7X4RSY2_9VIBR|nr:inositol monophosphatase family protein [Vibrio eleionomae]MZI91630.1 inositol monophosphatase [Vibrio eleionomae]
MNDAIDSREKALKTVILEAGQLALNHFHQRDPQEISLKGAQDFLTEADGLVENLIRDSICKQFPQDVVFGEESGGFNTDSDYLWIVDPIDGTANFARGIDHFCVTIALVYRAETLLGAIYNPVTDELYLARKGYYALKNQSPLHIAKTAHIASSSFELGWSTRVSQQRYLSAIDNLLTLGTNIRRGASGALALAWVAEGRTDGYAELHMNAWDCLAGLLLVREAGGYTGTYPQNFDEIRFGGPVFAAAPGVAQSLADALDIPLLSQQ